MSHVYRSIGFSRCEICWIESRPLRPLGGIFLEDKAVMKRLKPGQPGLFDVPTMPVCLTALQHRKVLILLGTLLTEALAERIGCAVIQSQEADDDEDHG